MKNNFLVIGYGNIAKVHITNIKKLYPNSKIDVLKKSKIKISNKNINNFYYDLKEINIFNYKYVFICSNTDTHFFYLNKFSCTKAQIFIEKPLINNLSELNKIQLIKNKLNNQITVGYVLRFHPIIIKLKKYLCDSSIGNLIDIEISSTSFVKFWNKSKIKEISYLDHRKGGGAVNELSHEIDLIIYLFKKLKISKIFPIRKIFNSNVEEGYKLFGKVNYNTNIFLNINFNSIENRRTILIKGSLGQIKADLINNNLEIMHNNNLKIKTFTSKESRSDRFFRQLEVFFNRNKLISSSKLKDALQVSKIIHEIKKVAK